MAKTKYYEVWGEDSYGGGAYLKFNKITLAMRTTNSFSTCPSGRGQKDRESTWDASASGVEDVSHHSRRQAGALKGGRQLWQLL